MGYMNRIQALLESEVRGKIRFRVAVSANRSRPGSVDLMPGDVVRLDISARNDSEVEIHRLAGFAAGTPIADFKNSRFEIERLKVNEHRVVARVLAKIRVSPQRDDSHMGLAKLTWVARFSFENLEIRDHERYLAYLPTDPEGETPSAELDSLPLSEVHSKF